LITKEDVEAAFGWGVQLQEGTNKPANIVGQRLCHYVPASGSAAPASFMLQIDVTSESSMGAGPRAGGITAATQYEAIRKMLQARGVTPVIGIGDDAWDGGCNLGGGLHGLVKSKGVMFSIFSMGTGKPCSETQAIWRKLAEKLVNRL
jgi:hypothetical protein